jgi:hypothetical protein
MVAVQGVQDGGSRVVGDALGVLQCGYGFEVLELLIGYAKVDKSITDSFHGGAPWGGMWVAGKRSAGMFEKGKETKEFCVFRACFANLVTLAGAPDWVVTLEFGEYRCITIGRSGSMAHLGYVWWRPGYGWGRNSHAEFGPHQYVLFYTNLNKMYLSITDICREIWRDAAPYFKSAGVIYRKRTKYYQ